MMGAGPNPAVEDIDVLTNVMHTKDAFLSRHIIQVNYFIYIYISIKYLTWKNQDYIYR